MSMFYKVMAALLLTLPVGAYVAGAQVGPSDDSPQTRLVRSGQPSPRVDRPAPVPTPRPSRVAHGDSGAPHPPATTDHPDETEHHEHSDHEDGGHDHGDSHEHSDHEDGGHDGGDEH